YTPLTHLKPPLAWGTPILTPHGNKVAVCDRELHSLDPPKAPTCVGYPNFNSARQQSRRLRQGVTLP
ncbi:hypothetical protein, partial [Campylobacter lanienae]|uniref:hypothetical protein n=1 Tax=Campylobacter lanienae TaxID=75658 RepID=UPI001F323B53